MIKKRKRYKFSKVVCTAIASLMLVGTLMDTQTNVVTYADGLSDGAYDGEGSGSGTFSGGGGAGAYFTLAQQGYRMYMVDDNFNLMSSILEITYESPWGKVSSADYAYDSIATEVLHQGHNVRRITWEEATTYVPELASSTPYPSLTEGSGDKAYNEMGDEFKQWVVDGIGGDKFSTITSELAKNTTTTSKSGTTSSIGSTVIIGGSTSDSISSVVKKVNSMSVTECRRQLGEYIDTYGAYEIIKSNKSEYILLAMSMELTNESLSTANKIYSSYMSAASPLERVSSSSEYRARLEVYKALVSKGMPNAIALAYALRCTGNSTGYNLWASSISDTDVLISSDASTEGVEIDDDSDLLAIAENSGSQDTELDQLIATSGSSGYFVSLLNYTASDGAKLMYYTYEGANNTSPVCTTMANKGFKLIVEPIYWLKYYVGTTVESHYIYGSIRDINNYYLRVKGYSRSGAKNKRVVSQYGPRSMTINTTVTFGSYTFSPIPESWGGDPITSQTLCDTQTTVGWGMHIYESEGGACTKTRSDAVPKGTEHEAPVPTDTTTYDEKVTIVKTYQTSEDGGVTYGNDKTYTKHNEPGTVYILNEEGWELTEYYVSTEASGVDNSKTTWDTMKSEVYSGRESSMSGTSVSADNWTSDNSEIPSSPGTSVELSGSGNQTTLYVLLRKKTTEESSTYDLTQSQISAIKSVDTTSTSSSNSLASESDNILLNIDGKTLNKDGKYYYSIYRGDDKLTMASYSFLDAVREGNIANWISYFGIGGTVSMGRGVSSYTAPYSILLEGAEQVDTSASVGVYSGKRTSIDTSCESTGKTNAVRTTSGVTVEFNPYIWMTEQTIDSSATVTTDIANVLGEFTRTVVPNDYAQVTFPTKGTLNVSSSMWATDKSIRSLENKEGDEIGTNTALKGGATYYLGTDTPAEVLVTTYQTVIDDESNYAITADSDEEIGISTLAAEYEHESLVDEVVDTLESNFKLHQYVDKNASSSPTTASGKTEVYSGANISSLSNGSSTASTASKYYLKDDGDITTSTYMETSVGTTSSKFYRFFSLPNGNIYMVSGSSYDECQNQMVTIVENAKANGGIYESNIVVKKGTTTILDNTAKACNTTTNIIDKMLATLEIGTGSDTNASWASEDGTWYSEGCLGFTIERQITKIELGILSTDNRVTVLDPKLIPSVTSKSKQNTEIFSSGYSVEYLGSSTLGTFRGQTVSSNAMSSLFNDSNTFYIPNSTVSDNK